MADVAPANFIDIVRIEVFHVFRRTLGQLAKSMPYSPLSACCVADETITGCVQKDSDAAILAPISVFDGLTRPCQSNAVKETSNRAGLYNVTNAVDRIWAIPVKLLPQGPVIT